MTQNSNYRMLFLASLISTLAIAFILNSPSRAADAAGDWPMWGGTPDRNMVSPMTGLPEAWDVASGRDSRRTPASDSSGARPGAHARRHRSRSEARWRSAGVVPSGNPSGKVFHGANSSPIRRYGHADTSMDQKGCAKIV